MTAAEFAGVLQDIATAAGAVIGAAVPGAKVYTSYAMDRDEKTWRGLLTPDDSDDVNAWMVGFAGLPGPNRSSAVRSIEPVLLLTVDGYRQYKRGVSEAQVIADVARVTWGLAAAPQLNVPAHVLRHEQLTTRARLTEMGGTAVHEVLGELRVNLQPKLVR